MFSTIRGIFGYKNEKNIKDKILLVPTWISKKENIFIDDVKLLIVDYLSPSAPTFDEFQNLIFQIHALSPSNSVYQKTTSEIIEIANIILACQNYRHFESEYKYYSDHPNDKNPVEFASFGLHALLTDSNHCSIDNMKKLFKLMPNSTNCELGVARCRKLMTPLDFACLTDFVSRDIVTYLFSASGNINHSYLRNNFFTTVLGDLVSSGMDFTRRDFITRLFNESLKSTTEEIFS